MNGREWENLPVVLNLQEVAEVLGVGYRTALTLVRRKDFPAFRIGKKWVASRDRLRAWVESQTDKELK